MYATNHHTSETCLIRRPHNSGPSRTYFHSGFWLTSRKAAITDVRQAFVPLILVAGILLGVVGVLAVYVRDTVVDSDEFARRAAVGLADPVVGE